MRYMASYDLMETMRNTNQWLGASALSFASYPVFSMVPNPALQWMAAWGEVTERAYKRMVVKPDWGIRTFTGDDGRDHLVHIETVIDKPFGNLVHFRIAGREPRPRKVLLTAGCETAMISAAPLVDFMRHMGPDTHVIAVCQPAPLTLAATAYLAEEDPKAQPRSLTLIGGPIDPDATPTDVTDFGNRVSMGHLEQSMIQRVGFQHKGVGRAVYPGLLQLTSFISMNSDRHASAFREQILRTARGEASDHDAHNRFYDEYLAVMDMTAEFYLSTVERIFKNREIAKNEFTVKGRLVDIGKITDVAVKTVEGAKDDISAPGQCIAALALCTGLPDSKKASHVEPDAGHYGIFAGKSWRNNIRPLVLEFIDANSGPAAKPKAANKNVAAK